MSVELRGAFLNDFNMKMEEILKELKRCVKVENIYEAIVTTSESDSVEILKITTKSYKDYKKLANMRNWPSDAFKYGIKLQVCVLIS